MAQRVAVWALPLVFAVTVHEAAHGWVADRLGDPTARKLGRITFNPLPHIDLVGTILVPMLMLAFTGFLLGWAKPVPVFVGACGTQNVTWRSSPRLARRSTC